jgi:hypothetical protein
MTYEGCHITERILKDYSRFTGEFYTRHKIVKAVIARVTSKQDFGSVNRDNWGARITRAFERKLIGKPCITPEEYETSFTTYARTAMKRDKQLGLFTKAEAPEIEPATPEERLVEMSIYWNPDARIVRAIVWREVRWAAKNAHRLELFLRQLGTGWHRGVARR